MESSFYRGSATEQTTRFTDKEKKLLREMKFEKQLETDVSLISYYSLTTFNWYFYFLVF